LAFYRREGSLPDVFTGHYGDGGICGALIEAETGVPFTFTSHSLGAQKMDKIGLTRENLAEMDARYRFGRRIVAVVSLLSVGTACPSRRALNRPAQSAKPPSGAGFQAAGLGL